MGTIHFIVIIYIALCHITSGKARDSDYQTMHVKNLSVGRCQIFKIHGHKKVESSNEFFHSISV